MSLSSLLTKKDKQPKEQRRLVEPDEAKRQAKFVNPVSLTIYFVIQTLAVVAGIVIGETLGLGDLWAGLVIAAGTLLALYFLFALKIADQWEKAVVLRYGKFVGLRGPGRFWIVPIVETIPRWIDHRVMVTPFNAEKTLTKDTVPVDVDAVLFWMVWDAEKAALEVEDYRSAITWAASSTVRS